MKTRLLIIIFVLVLIPVQLIYAVPELTPEDAFNYSEIVIVGKILSVDILSEPQITKSENSYFERSGIALYEIQIEEYLKNPSGTQTITVPGLFLREPHAMAYETYPYEVGQRVLLYLQKNDYGYANTDLIIRSGDSRVIDGSICDLGTSYHRGICIADDLIEPIEPIPTKEQMANAPIFCIAGYKQVGSECVQDEGLKIFNYDLFYVALLIVLAMVFSIVIYMRR